MRRPCILPALVVLGLLAVEAPARAQCTVGATALAFGSYDVYQPGPLDATGTVTIRCSSFQLFVAYLTPGSSAPNFVPRTMRKVAEALEYNIYRNAGRTNVWGDGTGATSGAIGIALANRDVVLTMYGRVPPLQDVSAGAYADTVTVIVNF